MVFRLQRRVRRAGSAGSTAGREACRYIFQTRSQGTRREGGEHSHPSPSIPLPVEGRGKSPSADLGKFGVHGPDARPLEEVEAPHEPGGPSPHPEPQGTRRAGGYNSHPSSSILLPVEGRMKKPADVSRNIGGSGGQGANFRGNLTLGPFP